MCRCEFNGCGSYVILKNPTWLYSSSFTLGLINTNVKITYDKSTDRLTVVNNGEILSSLDYTDSVF